MWAVTSALYRVKEGSHFPSCEGWSLSSAQCCARIGPWVQHSAVRGLVLEFSTVRCEGWSLSSTLSCFRGIVEDETHGRSTWENATDIWDCSLYGRTSVLTFNNNLTTLHLNTWFLNNLSSVILLPFIATDFHTQSLGYLTTDSFFYRRED